MINIGDSQAYLTLQGRKHGHFYMRQNCLGILSHSRFADIYCYLAGACKSKRESDCEISTTNPERTILRRRLWMSQHKRQYSCLCTADPTHRWKYSVPHHFNGY
jgi:hypothetical protein